jgi:glyoxylase-like metal-dependent hydrolase (beta-lactamase superfamily II)
MLMDKVIPVSSRIHRLEISTPFPVGTVNSYFVEGPVPTLIDTPPNGRPYLDEVIEKLRILGYRIQDIDRIIVTHPHIDHCGLASTIQEMSGVEVWASAGGVGWLEDYEGELRREEEFSTAFLVGAGVPEAWVKDVLPDFFGPARAFSRSVKPSRYLSAGDSISLAGTSFTVKSVPGHTPWCILIYDPESAVGFSGDFLLKDISSNALCQRPDVASPGYKSLKAYLNSLKDVRAMNLRCIFPGHGDIIDEPSHRIDELLSFIAERRDLVLSVLALGEQTPFQMMGTLFPGLPGHQLFLAISEIMGHLEVLEDEGLALRTGHDPVRFELVHP